MTSRWLIAALAASAALLTAPALAQDQGGDRQRENRGGSFGGGDRFRGGQPGMIDRRPDSGAPRAQWQGAVNRDDGQARQNRPESRMRDGNDRRDWNRGRDWNRDRDWNAGRDWNRQAQRDWNRDGDRDRRWDWNRDWRRDSRYDWQRNRHYNRNVYRLPAYRAPYGWRHGYRSFTVGIYLDSLLFRQSYWIDDPWAYRLPPAGGPLRWVRYYDDALLVDVRSGYVVDVIHRFFW